MLDRRNGTPLLSSLPPFHPQIPGELFSGQRLTVLSSGSIKVKKNWPCHVAVEEPTSKAQKRSRDERRCGLIRTAWAGSLSR